MDHFGFLYEFEHSRKKETEMIYFSWKWATLSKDAQIHKIFDKNLGCLMALVLLKYPRMRY